VKTVRFKAFMARHGRPFETSDLFKDLPPPVVPPTIRPLECGRSQSPACLGGAFLLSGRGVGLFGAGGGTKMRLLNDRASRYSPICQYYVKTLFCAKYNHIHQIYAKIFHCWENIFTVKVKGGLL
jgi:hypothetical protein